MTTDKSADVQKMFSRIARRYDLMNRLMTFGRDQRWRALAASKLDLPVRGWCLDLATGTGDLALAVITAHPTVRVTALDFALPMMQIGQRKAAARGDGLVYFGQADALCLPFVDAQFDGLINGFLLRNVVNLPQAFKEMRRVVKPGSQVVCLEITRPQTPVFRQLFGFYFYQLVPLIGGIVAGDLKAYRYLPNSLTHFPDAETLKAMMLEAGFSAVDYQLLAMGTMALHVATA